MRAWSCCCWVRDWRVAARSSTGGGGFFDLTAAGGEFGLSRGMILGGSGVPWRERLARGSSGPAAGAVDLTGGAGGGVSGIGTGLGGVSFEVSGAFSCGNAAVWLWAGDIVLSPSSTRSTGTRVGGSGGGSIRLGRPSRISIAARRCRVREPNRPPGDSVPPGSPMPPRRRFSRVQARRSAATLMALI